LLVRLILQARSCWTAVTIRLREDSPRRARTARLAYIDRWSLLLDLKFL
jgi:hypothetical protein